MINIEDLRNLCKDNKIIWSSHILKRIQQRNISQSSVIFAILNGEIIEQYENDFPFPSCLVLGRTEREIDLHIVCSITPNGAVMITAYYPDERFDEQNRIRKVK